MHCKVYSPKKKKCIAKFAKFDIDKTKSLRSIQFNIFVIKKKINLYSFENIVYLINLLASTHFVNLDGGVLK